MSQIHLVRFGAMAHVGRFAAVDALRYERGRRVIIRSSRGLELGEVLAPPSDDEEPLDVDGTLLRAVTVEDELLAVRLEKNRDTALAACQRRLVEQGLSAVLLDAELLFDGGSLIFHFLGEPDAEVVALTSELAEAYEAEAQVRQFAETLTAGCGPGCGTEEAEGGGCGSCGTGCAIAAACGEKKAENGKRKAAQAIGKAR